MINTDSISLDGIQKVQRYHEFHFPLVERELSFKILIKSLKEVYLYLVLCEKKLKMIVSLLIIHILDGHI